MKTVFGLPFLKFRLNYKQLEINLFPYFVTNVLIEEWGALHTLKREKNKFKIMTKVQISKQAKGVSQRRQT